MNQNCLTTDKLEIGPKRASYQTERLDPPIVETVTLKTPPGTVRDATETAAQDRRAGWSLLEQFPPLT
jgi:hypothetical protein